MPNEILIAVATIAAMLFGFGAGLCGLLCWRHRILSPMIPGIVAYVAMIMLFDWVLRNGG